MNNIRRVRKEKGLTLKQLAKQLSQDGTFKITPDAIAKYEQGNREPKLEVWQKLADVLNVDLTYLQGIGLSKTEKESAIVDVLTTAYNYTFFNADKSNIKEMAEQLDFSETIQAQLKNDLVDSDIYNFGSSFEEYLRATDKESEFADKLRKSFDKGLMWSEQSTTIFRRYLKPVLPDLLTAVNTSDSFTTYWTTDKVSGNEVRSEEPVPEIIISLAVSYLDGKNYRYAQSHKSSNYETDNIMDTESINEILYSISLSTDNVLLKLRDNTETLESIDESTRSTVQDIQSKLSTINKIINQ